MARKTLAQLEAARDAAESKVDATEQKYDDATGLYYLTTNVKKKATLTKKKEALAKLLVKARTAYDKADEAVKAHPDYVAPDARSFC